MSDADGSDGPLDFDVVRRHYHLLVLGALALFMLWVRLRPYGSFIVGGRVYFSGNDAWYHLRQVNYVVRHWPFTMPFDPWTEFPYGTYAGQFGTLYDQIVATAALIVGLGSPSQTLVRKTLLVAPAVFGALTVIPVYYIGSRLGDRRTGLFAAFLLALFPGVFLQRTVAGFADHNSIEPLAQAIAIAATMAALVVAERERPVYELLADRDWDGIRRPVGYGLLAGLATGLYVLVWPPAVFLIGVLGIFYTVALGHDYVRGRSPEHVAFVGATSMVVVVVVSLLWLDSTGFGVTRMSLMQPILAAALAAWCVLLAWLARQWERRDLPRLGYPGATFGLVILGLVVLWVVLPRMVSTIVTASAGIFAFGQTDTVLTIAEAQAVPFGSLGSFMIAEYGLAFAIGLAGLVWLIANVYRSEDYSTAEVLVVVWSVATVLMALTQVRFNYYLASVVAILSAYFLWRVLHVLDLERVPNARDVETYQVLVVLAVLMVAVVPLLPPIAGQTVVQSSDRAGPGGSIVWSQGLDWLQENSPAEGHYGGADQELPYYGTFERTDDFAYPDGAYGVMSWWDYGHWITVIGQRIPIANPFQGNAEQAATYLQATNETRANLILDALPSARSIPPMDEMSTAQLRSVVANQSAQEASEDTRYVMIDDQMAGGKFSAIATWAGPASEPGTTYGQVYYSPQNVSIGNTNTRLVGLSQRYENTMLARLYLQDANGLDHYRLVHESEARSGIVSVARRNSQGQYQSVLVGIDLRTLQSRYPGVYNAVTNPRNSNFIAYDYRPQSAVKTFERVEGATLTGTVPDAGNGTLVYAHVQLQTNTGRNFTYIEQTRTAPDGTFAMTVPYATNDAVGTAEGGTNSSVSALGEYTVEAASAGSVVATGSAAVPEGAIYEGREIQVELQPSEGGNASTVPGNQSTGSGDQPTGSDGQSGGSANGTAGSLTTTGPYASHQAIAAPEP